MSPWRSRRSKFLLALFLGALVLPGLPASGQAVHVQLTAPGPGTVIQGHTSVGYGNLSFDQVEERLVAYHEWRDVVTTSIERPGTPEEYAYGPAFDLQTGLYVGGASEVRLARGAGLLHDLGLGRHIEFQYLHGGVGYDISLPESLIWGRFVYPGESWTVTSAGPGGTGLREHQVSVAAGSDGAGVDVFVTTVHQVDDEPHVLEWRLQVHPDDHVFASDRALRWAPVATPRADSHWHDRPLTLLDAGGDPFHFQGRSHVALVGGPDQLMTFGTVGALPDDPVPHPMFDVREATAAALGSGHEAVRAFQAKAVDPYLSSAEVRGLQTADADVSWELRFIEAGLNELQVRIRAYKTPWTPLVVHEVDAELSAAYGGHADAAARSATPTVHPGSYARYFDDFAAERDRVVHGYGWQFPVYHEHGHVFVHGSYGRLHDHEQHSCAFETSVDGATGIVMGSMRLGFGQLPEASCDHEYYYPLPFG